MSSRLGRVGYADVVATIALFIALGGGAWALAKDSVDARAIENGQVRSQELKDDDVRGTDIEAGAVDGSDIADAAVGGAELADGSVRAAEIADGAVGGAEIAYGSVGAAEVADGSLAGADIDEATLFNDNSLTGADIAEQTLTGVQNGTGVTQLAAEQEIALFASVPMFQVPGGTLEYDCASTPILGYTNQSGADATVISSTRGVIQDDDGTANNAQVFVTTSTVADGDEENVSLAGVANLGRAEVGIIQDEQLIWISVLSRVPLAGCDFIATLDRQPR